MKQTNLDVKLPAVEIFGLKKFLSSKDDFITSVNSARNWYESLGFELGFDTYTNEYFAYNWLHKSRYTDTLVAHRILVFGNAFLQETNVSMFGGNQNYAAIHIVHSFLESMLLHFTILEFLGTEVENVKKHRATIYSNMMKGKFGKINLRFSTVH